MLESFITFSNTHNSWFQIHKQWGHQQIIGHLLSLSGTSPQRPTAKELLKHKFITRYTKKTAYLTELIDRYRRWKSEGHGEESSSDDSDMWVKQVIHQKRSKRVHAGDTDPISCRMIKSTLLKDIHRKSFRLWEILLKTYFLWKAKLRLNFIWWHWQWCCFSSVAFFRDADGDVDTCPMWTFPTVRPTSVNKLQKGYTHTDSEVRPQSGQLHTCTYYYFLFP